MIHWQEKDIFLIQIFKLPIDSRKINSNVEKKREKFMKLIKLLVGATVFLSTCLNAGPLGDALREKLKERFIQNNMDSNTITAVNSESGLIKKTLDHDGLSRQYLIHLPKNYDPHSKYPLLLAFHGGGGNMYYEADDSRYGFISMSDKDNIIVVFPNGYSQLPGGKMSTWNAGNCCGGARDKKVDDVGFIKELVHQLSSQYHLGNIYATGMSNGGMLTYEMACHLPDIFKAIASVAGTDNTGESCSTPVSVLHIHALDDDHVLFNGGAGKGAFKDERKVTDFTSVSKTIDKWTQIDQCSKKPEKISLPEGAYCETYSSCTQDKQVKLCVTSTGGHSWPGAQRVRLGKESPSQAFSANDMMWQFFQNLK